MSPDRSAPLRVVICVEYRLLGDSLAGVLAKRGIDVTLVGGDPVLVDMPDVFDVALTSGVLPTGVGARLVLRVEGPDRTAPADHETEGRIAHIDRLLDVLAQVDERRRAARGQID